MFETIYFAACEASRELAEQDGADGPTSVILRAKVSISSVLGRQTEERSWRLGGLENPLRAAPMHTASTAQILCNNEFFEQYTQTSM